MSCRLPLECLLQAPVQLMQIHVLLLTTSLSHKNSLLTAVLPSLILHWMLDADCLFDNMHKPQKFLCNLLTQGYINNDLCSKAFAIYVPIHTTSIRLNNFTFPLSFKVCTVRRAIWGWSSFLAIICKSSFTLDVIMLTELMLMYVRFGDPSATDYLLEGISERRSVAWNVLVAAYAPSRHDIKALTLSDRMNVERVVPDLVILATGLSTYWVIGKWYED